MRGPATGRPSHPALAVHKEDQPARASAAERGKRACEKAIAPRGTIHGSTSTEYSPARTGVLLLEGARLLGLDPEDAQPPEPPVRVPEQRSGREQVPGLVEIREVRHVRVLQRVGRRAVELRSVRPQDQQGDGEAVEFHAGNATRAVRPGRCGLAVRAKI